jgi:hypothetical protein
MKLPSRKLFPIALVIVLALVLIASSSGVALAVTGTTTGASPGAGAAPSAPTTPPSAWSCVTGSLATCLVSYGTYYISSIFDLFITLGGWLIDIGLQLTNKVYNSTAVQSGFGVTLALANLGFVLAIIVIAIATILQSESYGYKKTLWRLVAMAILINFGLVITAPIVGFANGMTTYFENTITQGSTGISAFSTQIATTLQLGQSQTPPTIPTTSSASASFTQSLMSLVFLIVFKFIVALAFFLIGLLLFVRFIYLAALMIVLPLAWLSWIFPNFSHQFTKWWEKFIHWTFFAPAAMFFIWLALSISQGFVNSASTGNSPGAALAATTGLSPVLSQFANNIIVVGLLIGGLMMASKLAEGTGQWAVAQGKAISNGVTGYVGRRTGQLGKRAGTAVLRTKPVRNAAARLQRPLTGTAEKWVNRFGLGIPDWTARKIGQGLEAGAVAGGSKTVDAAAERFKGLTGDQKINRLSGVEIENAAPQRMALLKQILDEKNIGKLSMEEMERYFGEKQKGSFAAFGQEKLYKDLREKSGLALRDLDKEIVALEAQPKPLTKADSDKLDDKRNEKKKLVATYIRENPEGAVDTFTDPDKLKERRKEAAKSGRIPASLTPESLEFMQRSIAEGVAGGLSTQIVSNLMKNLAEKNNLDGFQDAIEEMKKSKNPAIVTLVAKMKVDYANNTALKKWNQGNFVRRGLGVDLDKLYS